MALRMEWCNGWPQAEGGVSTSQLEVVPLSLSEDRGGEGVGLR